MAKQNLAKPIEKLEKSNESQEHSATSFVKKKDSETRQKLAMRFVNYYFFGLVLIIVGVPLYNYLMNRTMGTKPLVISIKDALLAYSAVVGPTFGLVVAYYFKSESDRP